MRSHGEGMAMSVGGRAESCTEPAGFVLQDRCPMCVHSLGTPAAVTSCQRGLHKWNPALVLLRTWVSNPTGTAMHCPYPGPKAPSPFCATQRKQSSLDLFQNIDCFRLTYRLLKNHPFFFSLGNKIFHHFPGNISSLPSLSPQLNGF